MYICHLHRMYICHKPSYTLQNVIYSLRCAGLKSLLVHAHRFRVTDFSNAKGDKKWMITTTTTTTTGVDFPKILGEQTKILGAEGGKK